MDALTYAAGLIVMTLTALVVACYLDGGCKNE